MYGWGYDSLLNVIDPRVDTLVASDSGWDVRDLAVNETDNEAYFFVSDDPARVYVIDGESNEVSPFVTLTDSLKSLLWVDPLDFLACICGDSTYLVDCRSQEVVRAYFRGRGYPTWALDQTNAILYDATPPGHVTAMHCAMDSAVVFDVVADRFCWDETRGGMFGAVYNAIHVFRYDPVGMHTQNKSKVRTREKLPSIVRGSLSLPRTLDPSAPVALFSITGRKVKDLQPGANDIRHIAPGVYFVLTEGSTGTRRVVITR